MNQPFDPVSWFLGLVAIAGVLAAYGAFVWGAFWAIERVFDWIDRRTR